MIKPVTVPLKASSRFIKRLYLGLILFFLYAPIGVLIMFSFNDSKSRTNRAGFTLDWYVALFQDPQIMQALTNTLLIAFLSALAATVLGTAAAVGINDMGKASKRILLSVTNLPVLNPDIVTGVSLMILYIFFMNTVKAGKLGFGTLLLAHIAFNVPYVILSILPKLRRMDKNLYEAALDLGASPIYAFFHVILPEIVPGIITGAMLAFTLSLDDFVVSYFTTGTGVNTLSILIYSMARRGINPKINALSTIMFVAVMLLLFLINATDSIKAKNSSKTEGAVTNETI